MAGFFLAMYEVKSLCCSLQGFVYVICKGITFDMNDNLQVSFDKKLSQNDGKNIQK